MRSEGNEDGDGTRHDEMSIGKNGLPPSIALVPQPCVCTSDRVGQPILEMEALP